MKNPELVIMAAGMGSRFGGLKQMEPIGPNGEFLMDFSFFSITGSPRHHKRFSPLTKNSSRSFSPAIIANASDTGTLLAYPLVIRPLRCLGIIIFSPVFSVMPLVTSSNLLSLKLNEIRLSVVYPITG